MTRRRDAEPAIRGAEAGRDRTGRFLPGRSPNPSGRPKVFGEFREAMRARSPKAVDLIDQALASGDFAERQWGADKVLAYAWGRPPQRVQVGGDEDGAPVKVEHGLDPAVLRALGPDELRVLLAVAGKLKGPDDGPG